LCEKKIRCLSAFCEVCNKMIKFNLSEDLDFNESGLAITEFIHGNPKHILIAYVDRFYTVRGESVIKNKKKSKKVK
jgi:hypothetical protein